MSDCKFCSIASGETSASTIYQDERVVAFMDIHPINPGHVLVVPRRHSDGLAGLDPEDGAQMMSAALRVAEALKALAAQDVIRCEGINLQLADGRVAGQSVFHVHLHVIPRYAGDGFGLKFPPSYFTHHLTRASLSSLAEKIVSAFPKA